MNRDGVKFSIISAEAQRAVLLPDEQDRWHRLGIRRFYSLVNEPHGYLQRGNLPSYLIFSVQGRVDRFNVGVNVFIVEFGHVYTAEVLVLYDLKSHDHFQ